MTADKHRIIELVVNTFGGYGGKVGAAAKTLAKSSSSKAAKSKAKSHSK